MGQLSDAFYTQHTLTTSLLVQTLKMQRSTCTLSRRSYSVEGDSISASLCQILKSYNDKSTVQKERRLPRMI